MKNAIFSVDRFANIIKETPVSQRTVLFLCSLVKNSAIETKKTPVFVEASWPKVPCLEMM